MYGRKKRSKKLSLIRSLVCLVLLATCVCLGFSLHKIREVNRDLKREKRILEEENSRMQESHQSEEEAIPQEEFQGEIMITAGMIIDEDDLEQNQDAFYQIHEIREGDAIYQRIYGKSYVDNDDISLDELRYLTVLHYNFDHQVQVGELIVNARISNAVIQIFRQLYEQEYEIQSMRLIDDYWKGDGESSDTASVEANNTSAFCYRTITGGSSLSNHAYGLAIDINPQQNPYVTFREDGTPEWEHDNAQAYIDRESGEAHMIVRGDACHSAFLNYGFSWGGDWNNPRDYQHFEMEY